MNRKDKIREAVIIVFVHQGLLYMVKRQDHLEGFPGYHSFPGGKVDQLDRDDLNRAAFGKNPILSDISVPLLNAVIRELAEEVQFDFEAGLRSGNILSFRKLGMATTPPFNPYRFKSHFFLLELKNKIDFQADPNEIERGEWKTFEQWLSIYHRGEILLVPPVITLLKIFCEGKGRSEEELSLDLIYDDETEVPCIESIYGVRQMPVLSNTLPPHNRTNAFLIGDEEKYLVDPSPASRQEMEKLLRVVHKYVPHLKGLKGLFLTHSHTDHYEFSADMARHLCVPLMMSQDTFERITNGPGGKDYFHGIQVDFVKEGDTLTTWLGEKVQIYSVPGHDEGQLALAPDSLSWFLVGDLIQGAGTVVISPPEGNMKKYFESLERIIRLSPKVIIPSHGIAMGGVHLLSKTLKHRRLREDQVLSFYLQGLSVEETLLRVYPDLRPELKPLARRNIIAHLEKLKDENKI